MSRNYPLAGLAALKSNSHTRELVTHWMQSFEDQMDRLESTGYVLEDIDKRMIFMDNLNKQIFSTVLSNSSNDMMRDNFPTEFKQLKTYIIRQFKLIRLNNPEVVNRVERGTREEVSFKFVKAITGLTTALGGIKSIQLSPTSITESARLLQKTTMKNLLKK